MSHQSKSSSSNSKGRIAQVLADARASLREPSRPYTPSSLDTRTSLLEDTMYKQQILDDEMNKPYYHLLSTRTKSTIKFNSDLSSKPARDKPNEFQNVKLLLSDLSDMINELESEVISSTYNINSSESKTQELLLNATNPINKIANFIKSDRSSGGLLSSSTHSLGQKMSQLLFHIVNSKRILLRDKQLYARHVLKYHLAYLSALSGKDDSLLDDETVSLVKLLKRISQAMYRIRSELSSSSSRKNRNDVFSPDKSPVTLSLNTLPFHSEDNNLDIISVGGVDLVLELLNIIWRRFDRDMSDYICAPKSISDKPAISLSEHSSASASHSHPFLDLLDSAVYGAAVVRHITGDLEIDRKRLVHLDLIDIVHTGFRLAENSKPLLHLLKSSTNHLPKEQQILSKTTQLLVQLTAIIRNYSMDSVSKTQLLNSKLICRLCNFQRLFHAYPELLLNCARITAKLSLFEPFRAQINSKSNYLKAMALSVINEAKQCHRIMENDGSEETDTDQNHQVQTSDWPGWHTWPLLSRVCFTLGNLTTSNDSNRLLIGVDCKLLQPLVILLQACSGSLSQLYTQNNTFDGTLPHSGSSKSPRQKDFETVANDEEEEEEEEDGEDEGVDEEAGEEEEEDEEEEGADVELKDATIKLLRLFTNLTISPMIGAELGSKNEVVEMLLELLCTSQQSVGCSSVKASVASLKLEGQHEELLLNVIAACTNLTYYSCEYFGEFPGYLSRYSSQQSSTAVSPSNMKILTKLDKQLTALSIHLCQCLFHDNDEIVLETLRVLGNLTRRPAVLLSLLNNRTEEALILLISHCNVDIVSAVTGCLVNLSSDPEAKNAILSSSSSAGNTINALSVLLRRVSFKDLQLSVLICQALHNLLSVPAGVASYRYIIPEQLSDTLSELIGCAQDIEEDRKRNATVGGDSDEFDAFVNVAGAVLKIVEGNRNIGTEDKHLPMKDR